MPLLLVHQANRESGLATQSRMGNFGAMQGQIVGPEWASIAPFALITSFS